MNYNTQIPEEERFQEFYRSVEGLNAARLFNYACESLRIIERGGEL